MQNFSTIRLIVRGASQKTQGVESPPLPARARVKNGIIKCFDDENSIARLHERLLAPIVSRHVVKVMEVSSREIQHLRSQLTFVRDEFDNLE